MSELSPITVTAAERRSLRGFYFFGLPFLLACCGVTIVLVTAAATVGDTTSDQVILSLAMALMVVLTQWMVRSSLRSVREAVAHERRFRRSGRLTQARVVGHRVESGEEPDHFLLYQFAPDFIVEENLDLEHLQLFEQPVGALVDVVYLADDQRQARLMP